MFEEFARPGRVRGGGGGRGARSSSVSVVWLLLCGVNLFNLRLLVVVLSPTLSLVPDLLV